MHAVACEAVQTSNTVTAIILLMRSVTRKKVIETAKIRYRKR